MITAVSGVLPLLGALTRGQTRHSAGEKTEYNPVKPSARTKTRGRHVGPAAEGILERRRAWGYHIACFKTSHGNL